MKKINNVLLFLICLLSISCIRSMEAPIETREQATVNWNSIPEEIKLMVISFLPQFDSYEDFVKSLTASRTSSEFKRIMEDPQILPAFFKKFIGEHPGRAWGFFDKAIAAKNKFIVSSFIKAADKAKEWAYDALRKAVSKGNKEKVEFLLDCGFDVNPHDGGPSALYLALKKSSKKLSIPGRNYPEIARLLLNRGADPNFQDPWGISPLMKASSSNLLETVNLLIDHGANVNARNEGGGTALMIASNRGHPDIVATLISRGAIIDLVDNRGESAFDQAKDLLKYEGRKENALKILALLQEGKEKKETLYHKV